MSQSLKNRFNGTSQEVVKYARNFGVLEAMEHYQVKDYVSMRNFLAEMAPEENLPTSKVAVEPFSSPDSFEMLLETMLHKYDSLSNAIRVKDARILELEKQIEYYKGIRRSQAVPIVESVLQYCKEG